MSNPEIIAELHRIADENDGNLRPSDVVEAARPAASPLHSQFEWRDTEAAHRYRLHQARQLISVTVEYLESKGEKIRARVFVSLTPDRHTNGGYRVMSACMSSPEYRAQLLSDAREEMRVFQQRYADLRELAAVFSAMRKVATEQPQATADLHV